VAGAYASSRSARSTCRALASFPSLGEICTYSWGSFSRGDDPLGYISPSRPTPLRSFFALFVGFHPCFPLSTLANIVRINRRTAKWRRERCRLTTRAFSANYQSSCLPKWLDKDCNEKERDDEWTRAFHVLFRMTDIFSFANFHLHFISPISSNIAFEYY